MIRVEEQTVEWARRVVTLDKEVLDRSTVIWAVYHGEHLAVVIGMIKDSMLGTGRVWLVPLRLDRAVIKACRAITAEGRSRFGTLIAATQKGRDTKFAEFCGFRSVLDAGEYNWVQL